MIGDWVSISKAIMGERFWGLVLAHWRGDYSLARAFWLHYLPVTAVVLGVLGYSFTPGAMAERQGIVQGLEYGFWAALAIAWIWALVGTLQSAAQHVARGGYAAVKTAALACIIVTIVMPAFLPLLFVLAMDHLPVLRDFLPHR